MRAGYADDRAERKNATRVVGKALAAVAISNLLGGVLPLAAHEIGEEPKIHRHDKPSPTQRKAPGRLSEEIKTSLNGLHKPWWKWERATGDWSGVRPRLGENGVILEMTYTGEVFGNVDGGIETGSEYRGNFDVTATLDTGLLGPWSGGTFFFYLQNGHGGGISKDYVGDVQVISNIEAEDFTQISEYWFEQRLFGDRLGIRLGKQDANVDFCALDYGGDFVNSSFGFVPTMPLPTFPDPALGAAAFVEPAQWMMLSVGVYDGAPNGGTSGFDTAFDGEGGTFTLAELALRTSLIDQRWNRGTYRVAAWFHSDEVEEITTAPEPDTFSDNHGIYLAFDQLLLKEQADPQDEQGLGAFAQFGWAPEDRNQLARYVGGGLLYTGVLPGRDEDLVGVGVAHVQFSDRVKRLDGRSDETAVEVFYKAWITPWLALQPDLQLAANPGGKGKDAFALGLRFAIDL